ncbi:MAG TPA: hypothetical protein VMS19_00895 [Methyloceanibacter sp.]|nr:hypothetical protein [Methyloceanibacter sp.]
MSVTRGKKGDTIIAFPGGKDDYVAVKESPEALFEDETDGAASSPYDSPSAGEHPAN